MGFLTIQLLSDRRILKAMTGKAGQTTTRRCGLPLIYGVQTHIDLILASVPTEPLMPPVMECLHFDIWTQEAGNGRYIADTTG